MNITRTSIYELMDRYGIKTAAEISTDDIEKSHRRCNGNIDDMVMELQISRHALIRRLKEMELVTG